MELFVDLLHIPSLYTRPTLLKDVYVAALSHRWCCYVKENLKPPSEFMQHPIYSPDEVQALLWKSENQLLGPDWSFVYIHVVPKSTGLALLISTSTHQYDSVPEVKDLSYSQFLHYVSQTNYKNLWKEAQKTYPETCRPSALNRSHRGQQKTAESHEVLRSLLSSAFNIPVISLVDNSVLHSKSPSTLAVQESYIESAVALFECLDHFVVITEHTPHNVQQCLSLSPTLLTPTSVRPMFVLYQMLHAVREMQDRCLRLEGVTWQHICIRQDLTIKVLPTFTSSLISPVDSFIQQPSTKDSTQHLQELTMSWVRGCLSNYEYLLALNDLAGRQMQNPYNHPVLPWISDLSSPFGNWRDLTKSKFRLNKGDRQLDLTFESPIDTGKVDDQQQQVVARHHVTDVLSEITYYVYKARRTAKSVLCRFVRPQWKPLEYPSSIERMQQWTPDECIPQFFSDPTIFKSIHDDLPDLGYPSWAASAEDFIAKHRNALESPYVSERLHQWIDLTFGFRLSGSAAVRAKNVHLSLVDEHIELTGRGVVQLFNQPHPRRLLPSPYVGRSPPRLPPPPLLDDELHIPLPLDYNPVASLRQLETAQNFCESTLSSNQPTTSTGPVNTLAVHRQRDLQWLMTLALELFLPQRFRLLRPQSATLEERLQLCRDLVRFDSHLVPRCLRTFVRTVLQNQVVTTQGLPPPSAHQLLQPMVNLIPFPHEFAAVLTATNQLRKADFAIADQLVLFSNPSSIALLIPFVKALLSDNTASAIRTALHLLDPIAAAIGPSETIKQFLTAILKLLGPEQPSTHLVYLYHRRFLLMLQVRLGLRCFLTNVSVMLVEAVGGCYDVDLIDPTTSFRSSQPPPPPPPPPPVPPQRVHQETESDFLIPVFDFEEGVEMGEETGTGIGRISGTPSRTSTKYSLAGAAIGADPVRDILQLDGCRVSQVSADSVLWFAHRLGPVLTARHLTRNLLRMLALCYADESGLSTATNSQSSEDVDFSPVLLSGLVLQGDLHAHRLLGCLSSLAGLYGEQMVIVQYLPHAVEVVGRLSTATSVSVLLEGGLFGSCSLLLSAIPCLQDASFMACLQDVLFKKLIDPMIQAVTSTQIVFTRSSVARSALTVKLIDCLCAIGIRLGTDQADQFVSPTALKLFKSFERVAGQVAKPNLVEPRQSGRPDWMGHHRRLSSTLRQGQSMDEGAATETTSSSARSAPNEAQALSEMTATFTDQFAFQLLTALNLTLGAAQVQLLLEQGRQMTVQSCAARHASIVSAGDEGGSSRRSSIFSGLKINNRRQSTDVSGSEVLGTSHGSRVSVVGNRIQLYAFEEDEISDCEQNPSAVEEAQDQLSYHRTDPTRHLRGNWLAYWEHEAGRSDRDNRFNFKQIRLLQFTGHTAGIRNIHVMDSETGLLTAGRDKTARVWNLQSQGDGSGSISAGYVYQQHRKPLLAVGFVEAARLAASCDGAVHLWDPFVGTSVRQLDASSATGTNRYPTVTAMKTLPAQSVLVAATAEGTLRLLDTRSPLSYQHELKISPLAAGLVRCLATGPNGHWVAAGHSSGILSLIDIRTGGLLANWKGHEGEVLQVSGWASPGTSQQHLISSSLDQSVSVWSADDGKLRFHLRGTSEPVHCLAVVPNCNGGHGELVTATTANRIGVHTSLTSTASFSSTRLRSDAFKGVLTSMAVVPLNRTLLLGSDTGAVTLLC